MKKKLVLRSEVIVNLSKLIGVVGGASVNTLCGTQACPTAASGCLQGCETTATLRCTRQVC